MQVKRVVAGILCLVVGTLSILPSLTGYVAADKVLRGGISFVSLLVLIGGFILIFSAVKEENIREVKEGKLAGLVLEPHKEKRHHRVAEVIQVPEFTGVERSMYIQLDDNPPLDNSLFINLPQTEELVKLMDKSEVQSLSNRYRKEIIMEIGRLDKQAYMNHSRTGRPLASEEAFANARALERFAKILSPGFKSRDEQIDDLRHFGNYTASLIRPLKEGVVTYVHIAPDHVVDSILKEGLKKEEDSSRQVYSFIFENDKKADRFISELTPEIGRIAGVRIDRYIMFKTPLVPGVAPQPKAYSAGCRKAMFPNGVPKELMYDVRTGKFTR